MPGVADLDFPLQIGRGFQRLIHKLLDVLFVDPVRPQPDLNLGCVQVLGLGGGQGLHIGPDTLLLFRGQDAVKRLGHTQLLAHLAGKIFVGGDKGVTVQVRKGFGDMVRIFSTADVPENHAGQLLFQLGFRFSRELCHEGHVYPGPLPNGDRQSVHRRVRAGNVGVLLDGPLGEHIRFLLQPPIIVQHFQGAEQIIGGIPVKGQTVGPVVDKAESGGKIVVEPVQLPLLLPDGAVRGVFIHREVNQLPHTVPQADHSHDALLGGGGQGGLHHDGVLPIIDLTVHNGIGVILHAGVRRDRRNLHFPYVLVQLRGRGLPVLAVNMGDRFMELLGEVRAGDGLALQLGAERTGGDLQIAQDHLRVGLEVAVHGHEALLLPPVSAGVGVFLHSVHFRPLRQGFVKRPGHVPLLEEHNVHARLRSRVGEGGVGGQADSAQQVTAAGDVLSCAAVLLVHGSAADAVGGDKGDHAARPDLINGFGKEIVVNEKMLFVIAPVRQGVISKRDVADGEVKEAVWEAGFLKAPDGDAGFWVKLLGDPARNAVQLHAVELGCRHALRQHPEKVSHTAGGFQDVAGLEAHIPDCFIDSPDDSRSAVMGVQGGRSRRSVFLRGERRLQLQKFVGPFPIVFVKSLGQTAPAHIPGQNLLFGRGGGAALQLNGLEGVDGIHVHAEFGPQTAHA